LGVEPGRQGGGAGRGAGLAQRALVFEGEGIGGAQQRRVGGRGARGRGSGQAVAGVGGRGDRPHGRQLPGHGHRQHHGGRERVARVAAPPRVAPAARGGGARHAGRQRRRRGGGAPLEAGGDARPQVAGRRDVGAQRAQGFGRGTGRRRARGEGRRGHGG